MRHIIRVFLPLIAIMVFVNLYFTHPDGIQPIGNYPIWMKDSAGKFTEQTSGLCYVGEKEGIKIFISADDIGKINRLEVDESVNPPRLDINEIAFSEEVSSLFQKFKRRDFEDIYFDRLNNKILLAIEGHEYSSRDPQIYRKKEGIYEITYNKDILTFDSILTIKRIDLPDEMYKHTFDNIGFEGISATENYFFIGLENYQVNGNEFSDSTILYILNRKTNELISIGTYDLKISTICGLYSADDYNLYGIDRNRRTMFYINFNEDFSINKIEIKEMNLPVPFHSDIVMILGIAPESITFDNNGDIYVAIDPWQNFYRPDYASKKKLSQEELNNFENGVPIMYKFRNMFN